MFITKVDADMAWPEFRLGQLAAVTFWRTVHTHNTTSGGTSNATKCNEQGVGVIVHGLYEGTADNLGQAHPFEEQAADCMVG